MIASSSAIPGPARLTVRWIGEVITILKFGSRFLRAKGSENDND